MKLSLVCMFCFALVVTSATAAPATVQFSKRSISVAGISPGSDRLIFGVVKILLTYYSRLQRFQSVITAGQDGTAKIQTDFDIPITSVWVVADLRTGNVVLSTPRTRGVSTASIGRSTIPGHAYHFSFGRSFMDLVYVHAGEGAWVWHAVDGGPGDEDGPNGITTIDISKGVHVTGAAQPKVFSPGGTLVAIDFEDLVVMTTDAQALLPGRAR